MKYVRSLALLLAVLASLSIAVGAEVLPEVTKPTGDPNKVVLEWLKDVQTYKKLVTDLAAPEMEGRGPGTRGIEKARDYLVNEFKKLELTPAFKDEKGEATFLQPFEISAGVHAKDQNLVILDKAGKAGLTPKAVEQYSPRGFSGDGDVTAPLVFIGYGVVNADRKYDSFAGLAKDELKGKIAVAYRFEPMDEEGKPTLMANPRPGAWGEASSLVNKAKWAAERGAAALLVVDPPAMQKEGTISSVAQTQGTPVTIPVMQVAPEVFRYMLREAGLGDESTAKQWERDANENHTKARTLEGIKATVKVKMERKKATIHNIAAVLPGRGSLKDEYIVIGGHYDHLGFGDQGSLARSSKEQVHHGADDNASGTAGVVLTAMRFAQYAKAPGAPGDRRSILFVLFSGEERGLLGSAHMLRKPEDLGIKLENMVAMLNMDMTGRMETNKLIASGSGSGDKFEKMITAAAKDLNIHVVTDTGTGIGGSDHQSFHAKKIPAVHFFTGIHVDYHKPSDTADKINNEGGTKVVDLVSSLTLSLWQTNEKITFQAVRMAHAASGGPRGGGAFLGIVPNYASVDGDAGCLIDGTTAGSPADTGGLKPDDIITAWDKKPVKNLHDLMAMLSASKPGQEITLKVTREKKEVELKVKLGTR